MTHFNAQAIVASRAIAVEHVRISAQQSFAQVRQRLEDTLPKLDASIAEALRSGDQQRVAEYDENGPKLSIIEQCDHGSLLQTFGGRRSALQYEIGNPVTAPNMPRYRLSAALYAPLRVVLFEDEEGKGVFEYDKPFSFFGQYGDERVTEGRLATPAQVRQTDAGWLAPFARCGRQRRSWLACSELRI
jgi:hypothetical protein